MKVKSDKDSTGVKKISLIDEFRVGMSYNLAAKEKPWSDMDISLRLKLSKSKTFNLSASFATYAYETAARWWRATVRSGPTDVSDASRA